MTLASGAWEELWAGPIEPYWKMFEKGQAAVEELPHQRLLGIPTGERGEVADFFGG